jgi:hypothetical protein
MIGSGEIAQRNQGEHLLANVVAGSKATLLLDVYGHFLPTEYTGLRGRPVEARWRTPCAP